MTEPKTCSTCHWWFQGKSKRESLDWGLCSLHSEVKKENPKQVWSFCGIIKTRDDFGCIKHEEDRRQ